MTIHSMLAFALAAAIAAPAAAEQNITKRATVEADATIEVSNVQGSVEVTAWDRNEVELVAVLESDKDELEFEATPRIVRIEVDRPDGKYGRDHSEARLKLRVPAGAVLVVDTVSADITVAGVRGSFDGEVVSGEIHATIVAAREVEVNSVSGDITIDAELAPSARVEMESVSGTIGLKIKPPVNADFDLESFSGDIDVCFGPKARETSRYAPGTELSFTQGNGGARIELQTLSGDISICDR